MAQFPANNDLSRLDGSDGFKISGPESFGKIQSAASAGDVNGDGFAGLIVGAPDAFIYRSNDGASYVIFGKASGFGATFDVSTLNGSNGSILSGIGGIQDPGDLVGGSVASAGDINGDSYADLIVGAELSDAHGRDSGASYVVFGKAGGFNANLRLSTLDGAATASSSAARRPTAAIRWARQATSTATALPT